MGAGADYENGEAGAGADMNRRGRTRPAGNDPPAVALVSGPNSGATGGDQQLCV